MKSRVVVSEGRKKGLGLKRMKLRKTLEDKEELCEGQEEGLSNVMGGDMCELHVSVGGGVSEPRVIEGGGCGSNTGARLGVVSVMSQDQFLVMWNELKRVEENNNSRLVGEKVLLQEEVCKLKLENKRLARCVRKLAGRLKKEIGKGKLETVVEHMVDKGGAEDRLVGVEVGEKSVSLQGGLLKESENMTLVEIGKYKQAENYMREVVRRMVLRGKKLTWNNLVCGGSFVCANGKPKVSVTIAYRSYLNMEKKFGRVRFGRSTVHGGVGLFAVVDLMLEDSGSYLVLGEVVGKDGVLLSEKDKENNAMCAVNVPVVARFENRKQVVRWLNGPLSMVKKACEQCANAVPFLKVFDDDGDEDVQQRRDSMWRALSVVKDVKAGEELFVYDRDNVVYNSERRCEMCGGMVEEDSKQKKGRKKKFVGSVN